MKILAISGSLRANSSNTAILNAVIGLAPDLSFSLYTGLGDLPHFNPELDSADAIAPVSDWRAQLQAADGIIFCTPEYAHGVPGVLKNALDWVVSSGEFMHKPTAVISASPSMDGGDRANRSLVQTLKVMLADIPASTTLCIPMVSAKLNQQHEVSDAETLQALQSLLKALTEIIAAKESDEVRS